MDVTAALNPEHLVGEAGDETNAADFATTFKAFGAIRARAAAFFALGRGGTPDQRPAARRINTVGRLAPPPTSV